MKNFISRFFVVCLLLSIVTAVSAQDRNIDKSGSKQEQKQDKKSKNVSGKGSSRLQNDDTASGPSSGGVKSKASGPSGKVAPGGGNSARMGNVATAPKSGKKAKKGFLGRLLGRSSKKASSTGSAAGIGGSPRPGSKSGGQTGGKQPSAGGDKQQQPKGPAGEKPGQGQGDDGP